MRPRPTKKGGGTSLALQYCSSPHPGLLRHPWADVHRVYITRNIKRCSGSACAQSCSTRPRPGPCLAHCVLRARLSTTVLRHTLYTLYIIQPQGFDLCQQRNTMVSNHDYVHVRQTWPRMQPMSKMGLNDAPGRVAESEQQCLVCHHNPGHNTTTGRRLRTYRFFN